MNLPQDLRAVLAALARRGRPFLAGGCVRDWLLGREAKDFDVEVYGLSWEEVAAILRPFGPTDVVGRSFGVIKLRLGGAEYDIALPRRETKTGAGHRGFAVEPDAQLDERTACARRDFTINAILYDPLGDRLVDHFDGAEDLRRRVLRHTSAAFVEDPLRVLRGFQFAARFDLNLAAETATLCASIAGTFGELARERIWGEWDKFATRAEFPGRGLAVLKSSGWLRHFPELAAIDGTPQDPEWHPEGDVFTHTAHCCDALVALPAWREAGPELRRVLMFAVLGHDFGKPATTHRALKHGSERWVSPGHAETGGPLTAAFLERLGSPLELRPQVQALVENHHAHTNFPAEGPSASAVRRLARRLAPATIDQLLVVMEADHRGRPPLLSENSARRMRQLRDAAHDLALESAAPRPILLGRDLIALGQRPGRHFAAILDAAFEAQLDGVFSSHDDGMAWLRDKLRLPPLSP
ncbi:MAG: polynucleotide adenylyltransferase [Opitutaceae bacterium]|nr:polynucleotide adenylyltransferase [Opitutaceae bacterium]